MKTIQLTDEQYDFLITLSKELRSQDNRITANPRFYAVQSKKKLCSTDPDHYENRVAYDGDGYDVPATIQGIKDFCKDTECEVPENVEDFGEYEIESFFEDQNMGLGSWTESHEYSNAFLTEKACKEHIETNRHHYSDPVDFLFHAFRNPELEQLIEIVTSLSDEKEAVLCNTVEESK